MLSLRFIALKAVLILATACADSPVGPTPEPAPAPVATITLSAQALTVQPGQTVQVTATPRDALGQPLTGRPVTWSSTNEAAVVITNGDRITSVAAGTAEVRATAGGKTASLTITVVEVIPVVVELRTPTTELLATLGTAQFLDVVPVDATGALVPNIGITWSSTTPTVASVSAGGAVMTHRPGVTTITATAAGKEVAIAVIVTPAPSTTPTVRYALQTVDGAPVGATIWSELAEETEQYTVTRLRRIMAATITWDVVTGHYMRSYQVRSSTRTTYAWGSTIESQITEETVTDEGSVGDLFAETGVVFSSAGPTWPPILASIGIDGSLTMRQPIPGGAGSKTLTYRSA